MDYLPTGGFYRRALYSAAARFDLLGLLHLALGLARECEYLRTWALENGLQPPHFESTPEQAALSGSELLAVSAAVNRSRIGAGGAELVPKEQPPPSLVQRGA